MIAPVLLLAIGASPVELVWRAPDRCPSRDTVGLKVVGLLGHPLLSPAGIERVVAEVAGEDPLQLVLHFSGASGEQARTLEDPDCAALTEAAALIIAIALDPEAMGEEPPPPPPPRPPRTGLDAPGIPFEIPYARIGIGALGGANLSLSAIGGDLALSGAVLWSLFRFELLMLRSFPRGLAGGSVGLWSASAVACLDPLGGALELPLCLGGTGMLYEVGLGGGAQNVVSTIAGGPSLSASLIWSPTSILAIRGRVEGAVALGRPTGPDGVDLPLVALGLLIGAEVRFP